MKNATYIRLICILLFALCSNSCRHKKNITVQLDPNPSISLEQKFKKIRDENSSINPCDIIIDKNEINMRSEWLSDKVAFDTLENAIGIFNANFTFTKSGSQIPIFTLEQTPFFINMKGKAKLQNDCRYPQHQLLYCKCPYS